VVFTSNGYVMSEASHRWGPLTSVPDEERGSRQLLLDRLSEQGYLYLPGFLDPRTVVDFRRYYFATLAGTGLVVAGSDPEHGVAGSADEVDRAALRTLLFRQIVPGPEYLGFCGQPAIRDWFAWLLDDDVHLHRRKIIRHTHPDEHRDPQRLGVGSATQAHYDLLYLREGSDQVLSMWIPLGDCPRQVGGLIYLEGSHRWVIAEERFGSHPRPAASITADLPGLADRHDARWLSTDYAVGDVVVHTAHIVHAALDNVDPQGRLRLSTDIRYQRMSDPIDRRWQRDWHDRDGL
jgi:hypothetical protein